jgi:hypothetical protein
MGGAAIEGEGRWVIVKIGNAQVRVTSVALVKGS